MKLGKTIEKIYTQMGLQKCQTPLQEQYGTLVFFDPVANCKFVFRLRSSPRVEYFSGKTESIQSYVMFESESNSIKEKMLLAIPYIQKRQIKGLKERTRVALDIFQHLIK